MRICIACACRRTIGRSRWCLECRTARRRASWTASARRRRPARDPRCVDCGALHERRSPRCADCAPVRHRQQRTVWQKEQRRKARTKHNRDLSPDLIERFLEQETLRRRPWARAQALAAKTEAA